MHRCSCCGDQKEGVKNPKLAKLGVTTVWYYLLLLWASLPSVPVVAGGSRGVFPSQLPLSWGHVNLNVFWLLSWSLLLFPFLVKVNPPCSLNTKVSIPRQRPAQAPAFRRAWGVLNFLTFMDDYKHCRSPAVQTFPLLVFVPFLQSSRKCLMKGEIYLNAMKLGRAWGEGWTRHEGLKLLCLLIVPWKDKRFRCWME